MVIRMRMPMVVGVNAEDARRDQAYMEALLERGQHPQAPAVRLSKAADGFWYVDVRRTATGAFSSDSRHASLDEALERVQEVAR